MAITGLSNGAATSIVNTLSDKTNKASDATAMISTGSRLIRPSVDASSFAISSKLSSNIDVLSQAAQNAAQGSSVVQVASGALANTMDILTTLKTLATKANDGSTSDAVRGLINADYQRMLAQVDSIATQTRWNGTSLLSSSNATATMGGAVTQAITGLGTVVANTFAAAPVNVTNSRGFVSGSFTDATVTDYGLNQYKVSVTMKYTPAAGDAVTQTFVGIVENPVLAEAFTLVSTSDDKNILEFDYHATDVTGLNNAANFQTNLRSALNIGAGLNGATLTSTSTAVNNGVTGITASSNTAAGTYAVEYDSNTNILKMTNGTQKWEQTMTAAGAQTVTFSNGVTVTTDGTFALGTAVTQMVFDVGAGSQTSMAFQIAELSSDTLTVNISGASAANLGINGTSVTTQALAQTASNALDTAISNVNNSIATLGAQQKQLESTQANLKTTIENNKAARAVFNDADIADTMTELTTNTVFAQMSNAMLTQALQLQKDLVNLVR